MDARVSEFSVAEAKARFSELIARAEAGEDVVIRKHGAPVARVVPIDGGDDRDIARKQQAWRDWNAYRAERRLTLGPSLTIRQLVDGGRKY